MYANITGYGYDTWEPEDDAPDGRCHGNSERGCGRFCGTAWICPRCEAELREILAIDAAEEAAYIQKQIERDNAYWETWAIGSEDDESRARAAWLAEQSDDDAPTNYQALRDFSGARGTVIGELEATR